MTVDRTREPKFVCQAPASFGCVLRSCAALVAVLLEGGMGRDG